MCHKRGKASLCPLILFPHQNYFLESQYCIWGSCKNSSKKAVVLGPELCIFTTEEQQFSSTHWTDQCPSSPYGAMDSRQKIRPVHGENFITARLRKWVTYLLTATRFCHTRCWFRFTQHLLTEAEAFFDYFFPFPDTDHSKRVPND